MLKLLFIPFLTLLCFSCEHVLDKDDSLFYQISEADSIKYSKELHQLLKQEVLDQYQEEKNLRNKIICDMPPPYHEGDILSIQVTNEGEYFVQGKKNSSNLSNMVFEFFMKNRDRTDDVYLISDTDAQQFPFYNVISIQKMNSQIVEREQELVDIKSMKGADPLLIEYYAKKVRLEKEKLDLFSLFESETLAFMGGLTCAEIKSIDSDAVFNEALDEVIDGYIQLRSYECLRYFGESYLRLFWRAQEQRRQIDFDKLDGLKRFRPIRIRDFWLTPPEVVVSVEKLRSENP